MKIHKEGYASLLLALLFVFGVAVVLNIAWNVQTIWHYIIYSILAVLFLIVLQFFRSPARQTQIDSNNIVSCADGKVVVIEKTVEEEYFKDERLQISVFMSPINVHVNRYPISGLVKFFKYHPGKYLVAWHPKSSTENERTTVVLEHPEYGSILVRQIAGALARRIVCYSKDGQEVVQGTELGFIKFGSRVDIFLPLTAVVRCSIGDTVQGGVSILASFTQSKESDSTKS
jgi:phosphatidylserine decarboxylase